MIDEAGRLTPRFTTELEPAIREEIRAFLQSVKAGYGYSSAACGGDLIFCECLLEMDAKVNLVLPCPVNAFKRQSVSFGGPEWERRFHDVMAWATTCLIANSTGHGSSHVDGASSLGLVYANRILTGLAALQAQALDLELEAGGLVGRPAGHAAGGTVQRGDRVGAPAVPPAHRADRVNGGGGSGGGAARWERRSEREPVPAAGNPDDAVRRGGEFSKNCRAPTAGVRPRFQRRGGPVGGRAAGGPAGHRVGGRNPVFRFCRPRGGGAAGP